MKNAFTNTIHNLSEFIRANKTIAVMIAAVVVVAIAVPVGLHMANGNNNSDLVPEVSASELPKAETTTEKVAEKVELETTSEPTSEKVEVVSTTKKESKKDVISTEAPAEEKAPIKNESKPKPTTAPTEAPTTAKKDWLDTSGLTGTQADVGKVVGYSSTLGKDITVVSVVQETKSDGRKVIKTTYSDYTGTCVVECEYCHNFPCPDGGGSNCSQYNAKNDATVYCSQCGKPCGDGYNGTCHGLIDWANGGTISCNYYN